MKKALTIVALGLLVGLVASPALAGGSTFTRLAAPGTTNVPIVIAQETINTAAAGQFNLPTTPDRAGNGHIYRQLAIVPSDGVPFVFEVNQMTPGVTWTGTLTNVTLNANDSALAGCTPTITPIFASATQYRWRIEWTGCTAFPRISLKFSDAADANFVDLAYSASAAAALASGTNTMIQARLLDGNTLAEIPPEQGADTVAWISSALATGISAAAQTATTATLDVSTQKKNFVATGGDTLLVDNGASLVFPDFTALGYYVYGAAVARNAKFSPNVAGAEGHYQIEFVPVGGASFADPDVNLTIGVTTYTGVDVGANQQIVLTAADSAAGSTARALFTDIGGAVSQSTGSYQLTISYVPGTSSAYVAPTAAQIRLANWVYTVWGLNGSVLYAPFVNGNTAFYTTRFYVCAPLSAIVAPTYDVVVWTIPVVGTAGSGTPIANLTAQGGPNALDADGCLNIKLEDILTNAGIALPYQTNGGNLAVEFTIPAPKVLGIANVFSTDAPNGSKSLATYPLFQLN